MARQIFRQAALNRLSTPEQLDQPIALAPPRDRLALAACLALFLAALAWGLGGRIPARLSGSGFLLADPAGREQGALMAQLTLPTSAASRLRTGQEVLVFPVGTDRMATAALRGTVRATVIEATFVRIEVALVPAAFVGDAARSTVGGPPITLAHGTPCQAAIDLGWRRPLALLLSP